jgi:hypothetical protein
MPTVAGRSSTRRSPKHVVDDFEERFTEVVLAAVGARCEGGDQD